MDKIYKVYEKLRIPYKIVEKYERKADTNHPDEQAKSVLRDYWREREGKKMTRGVILRALEECELINSMETLQRKWKVTETKKKGKLELSYDQWDTRYEKKNKNKTKKQKTILNYMLHSKHYHVKDKIHQFSKSFEFTKQFYSGSLQLRKRVRANYRIRRQGSSERYGSNHGSEFANCHVLCQSAT